MGGCAVAKRVWHDRRPLWAVALDGRRKLLGVYARDPHADVSTGTRTLLFATRKQAREFVRATSASYYPLRAVKVRVTFREEAQRG